MNTSLQQLESPVWFYNSENRFFELASKFTQLTNFSVAHHNCTYLPSKVTQSEFFVKKYNWEAELEPKFTFCDFREFEQGQLYNSITYR